MEFNVSYKMAKDNSSKLINAMGRVSTPKEAIALLLAHLLKMDNNIDVEREREREKFFNLKSSSSICCNVKIWKLYIIKEFLHML